MSDFFAEVIALVAFALLVSAAYASCPAEDCQEAVSRCAATEGIVCHEVKQRCRDAK